MAVKSVGKSTPGIRLAKAPNVWELRVYVGRNEKNTPIHKHRRFKGSFREAQSELMRWKLELGDQRVRRNDQGIQWEKITVNQLIELWKEMEWPNLSPTTTKRYESIIRNHIESSIGKRKIVELTTLDIERFLNELSQKSIIRKGSSSDSVSSGKLSMSSVRQTRAILGRICKLSEKWSGDTLKNPVAKSELRNSDLDPAKHIRAPRTEEVNLILEASKQFDIRYRCMVRVIAATGMRRGELCALQWGDIDFTQELIKISKAVVGLNGKIITKGTKTVAGNRRLAIDSTTLNELRSLKATQAEFAQSSGNCLSEDCYVFSFEPSGTTPPHPDSVSHAFSRIRDAAGVSKEIHLHSMRHFQATAVDAIVSDRQKQSRLGWSTIHMAMHYTDDVPEYDRKAAYHIGELLG
ncbi:MAG: site-specific integrase [Actinomycetota bacterium]|nr:site-specific integrase [Actinomycetota bacterium]